VLAALAATLASGAILDVVGIAVITAAVLVARWVG
jgi:hypothetical protein